MEARQLAIPGHGLPNLAKLSLDPGTSTGTGTLDTPAVGTATTYIVRDLPNDGWQQKKRSREDQEGRSLQLLHQGLRDGDLSKLKEFAWMTEPEWRSEWPIDFTIENPGRSKLWLLDCVRALYDPKHSDPWDRDRLLDVDTQFRVTGLHPCTKVTTTYCRYGLNYRKPTSILTSIAAFEVSSPCTKNEPCALSGADFPKHPQTVQDCDQSTRNQLPIGLTHDLLRGFVLKHRARGAKIFLFIDVFEGWGSVSGALAPARLPASMLLPTERLIVYTNDIKERGPVRPSNTLDMSISSSLALLLRFALLAKQDAFHEAFLATRSDVRGTEELFKDETSRLDQMLVKAGIAVLFHCSFPCTTYSTAAGATHRSKGSIASDSVQAARDDGMAESIVTELVDLCALRRPAAGAPSGVVKS